MSDLLQTDRNIACEQKIVKTHVDRARKAGQYATLTLDEWIATLNYFDWKCAYCPNGSYELLEHFISISLGGGTTHNNCVPACYTCNSYKARRNPLTYSLPRIQKGIEKVYHYLKAPGVYSPVAPVVKEKVKPTPKEVVQSFGSEEAFWQFHQKKTQRYLHAWRWQDAPIDEPSNDVNNQTREEEEDPWSDEALKRDLAERIAQLLK